MLYEYAVEPRAIGSSWATFRYLIEKFGFDKGRLIVEFPRRWVREVYDATASLPPVQKKYIEVALNQAKKNKVVRSGRPYDREAGDWLFNALAEHRRSPFHAIIALENPNGDEIVLPVEEINENHFLMSVLQDSAVERTAFALAQAMKGLLIYSSHILFVDPFYDPFRARYKNTIRACLKIVHAVNPHAVCEIHHRHHDGSPTASDFEREARNLFPGVIPQGMTVSIYRWRQKDGGEDFHDRFLLTEKGGIGIGAGFSADGGHQTTNMHLMSFDLSQAKVKALARGATTFDLVEPVLRVSATGDVEHL